jgi:hypothetical protein
MVSIVVATARAEFEFLHHHPDNQTIVHKLITLPILYILLERPTDDSDEITIQFAHNVSTTCRALTECRRTSLKALLHYDQLNFYRPLGKIYGQAAHADARRKV